MARPRDGGFEVPALRVVRSGLRGRGPRLRRLGGTGRVRGLARRFHAEAAVADAEAGRG